jgi:hypothetical protein
MTTANAEVSPPVSDPPQPVDGVRSYVDEITWELRGRQTAVMVNGWAVANGRRIRSVYVVCDDDREWLPYPLPRPDVARTLCLPAGGDSCGFRGMGVFDTPLSGLLSLEVLARLDDGELLLHRRCVDVSRAETPAPELFANGPHPDASAAQQIAHIRGELAERIARSLDGNGDLLADLQFADLQEALRSRDAEVARLSEQLGVAHSKITELSRTLAEKQRGVEASLPVLSPKLE